jgi:L-asparaginase II
VEPLVVEVTRGHVVEARHVVHAVVVHDGQVQLAAGDPALVVYLRSSAKPLQALPVVRARPDLDDEQVALVCASHGGSAEQLAVVRRLLADAPATEDDLQCGFCEERILQNC